jgi:hypothetical protein
MILDYLATSGTIVALAVGFVLFCLIMRKDSSGGCD